MNYYEYDKFQSFARNERYYGDKTISHKKDLSCRRPQSYENNILTEHIISNEKLRVFEGKQLSYIDTQFSSSRCVHHKLCVCNSVEI